MRIFCVSLCLALMSASAFGQSGHFSNERVAKAFEVIRAHNQTHGVLLSQSHSRFEVDKDIVAFTDETPLTRTADSWRDPDGKQQTFEVRTIFLRQSSTIEKRVHLRQGPDEMARMRFILRPQNRKENMAQYTFQDSIQAWQIYEGSKDIFFYTQEIASNGEVQLKEWIYAEAPNDRSGSLYTWDVVSEEFNRFTQLKEDRDGSAAIQRHVMVGGVDPKDKKEQMRVVGVVREAMKAIPIYIHGEDVVGRIQPVRYWTREGILKQGLLSVKSGTRLAVVAREPASAYPLVIDPGIVFAGK